MPLASLPRIWTATNKLPLGDRRDRLRHGCREASAALSDGALAAAYADAAAARLPSE
ncbi:hypothetical protein [Halorubrum sp. HHNYT27]|uniref:hypothetical protein n=1 Tax=Halorubrum sp. HHNYT27 TaxID=3402275 RepID=UPI003EB92589